MDLLLEKPNVIYINVLSNDNIVVAFKESIDPDNNNYPLQLSGNPHDKYQWVRMNGNMVGYPDNNLHRLFATIPEAIKCLLENKPNYKIQVF